MEFNALVSFALATLFFGVGIQIYGNDLLLSTGIYHYRTRLPQAITYIAVAIALYFSISHPTILSSSGFSWIDLGIFTVAAYIVSFAFEWTLTPHRVSSLLQRLVREGRLIREGSGSQTRYRAAAGHFGK